MAEKFDVHAYVIVYLFCWRIVFCVFSFYQASFCSNSSRSGFVFSTEIKIGTMSNKTAAAKLTSKCPFAQYSV